MRNGQAAVLAVLVTSRLSGRQAQVRCDDGAPLLIHHSDRGSQYTSAQFTALDDYGVAGPLGSTGDANDNAMAESVVDSVRTELIADRAWRDRPQLELAIVEWTGRYSNRRPPSALGDVPPGEDESLHAPTFEPSTDTDRV
jgi:transposase InsO family protein